MWRLAVNFLENWKGQGDRHPLLIRGARQVGKTWLVREHGRSYSSFVEINLESHPEYLDPFRELYGKPKDLIAALALLSGEKIIPGETLLFIDEIQESREAILSLRYFKESLPLQHLIAAGSLLEFSFRDFSYPVGRIEFFHLFPMNFREYLLANSRDDLAEAIANAGAANPLPEAVHRKLLEDVTNYCLIGGMPEAVKAYVETGNLQSSQSAQQILIASFREDFYKYASKANVEYLRILFQGIPRLLGQKFKYSHMDPEIKSRELSAALSLLEKAGLVYKTPHSSANGLPLGAQIHPKKFKVFFLDVGLCHRILGLNLSQLYLERKDMLANRGAVAEQFVAQELVSLTPPNQAPQLFYWHREEKSAEAEVDLLIEHRSAPLPIEVKSGRGNGLKSLRLFLREKEKYVKKAVKVSTANFSDDGTILSLPFYALSRLRD